MKTVYYQDHWSQHIIINGDGDFDPPSNISESELMFKVLEIESDKKIIGQLFVNPSSLISYEVTSLSYAYSMISKDYTTWISISPLTESNNILDRISVGIRKEELLNWIAVK